MHFQPQHFLAQRRDGVNLALFFLADEADQPVLFHLGKAAVHGARTEPHFPVRHFRHSLHNAVAVHLLAQAEQDVKARFRHRHIHFANVRVHRVLTPFSAIYRTAMH